MLFKGLGIKARVFKAFTKIVKALFPVGSVYRAPGKTISSAQWVKKHSHNGSRILPVYEVQTRKEPAPLIFNYEVTGRFKRYYERKVQNAYVLELADGMAYGADANFIITSDLLLLDDVSREFGRYGGKQMCDSSLINQRLSLPSPLYVKGNVAVISTCGSLNFHHWNYDAMPRVHLLKEAGIFESINYFIINHSSSPFQLESLRLIGIPPEKVIKPVQQGSVQLIQAEKLVVPSLPSPLGTVSPWVIGFLRKLYIHNVEKKTVFSRIYLSRKHVTTRKIINNDAFERLLTSFNIIEVFPEDYSVSEMAAIIQGAMFIISVHGSGLSNLCFVSEGTIVIDILAPYHDL